ncbi:MAG: hypothetical protein AABX55_03285, partial [Nanoarchaeota archaeon]
MTKEEIMNVKKMAYSLLEKLKRALDKNRYDEYMKLKKDYNKLLRIIDEDSETTGDESFLWDKVRNKLDLAFSMRKSANIGV